MSLQKCPLCREIKEVVSSHLMPAALYDYCRPTGGNPVAFNSKLVIETSRQTQHSLLCRECEDILNKRGEQWILPLFAHLNGSFPFHELLTKTKPAIEDGAARVYAAARNPEIDTAKVTHFAMGIFWKAAVHPWSGTETDPRINLGASVEPIRRYLRNQSPFPAGMALTVAVLPTPVKHISFTMPYQGSNEKWLNFVFYVLGIEFVLLVSDDLPTEQIEASFTGNPERPILLVDFAPLVQDIAVEVMKKAHKAKNVQKYLRNTLDR
ncbi:MAG TPA: hypothetical protein VGS59_07890 [Candidatus Acidoferrales bacterium]|nr:hypothetical protein [Candidatus Acidoferrales bacterium]